MEASSLGSQEIRKDKAAETIPSGTILGWSEECELKICLHCKKKTTTKTTHTHTEPTAYGGKSQGLGSKDLAPRVHTTTP